MCGKIPFFFGRLLLLCLFELKQLATPSKNALRFDRIIWNGCYYQFHESCAVFLYVIYLLYSTSLFAYITINGNNGRETRRIEWREMRRTEFPQSLRPISSTRWLSLTSRGVLCVHNMPNRFVLLLVWLLGNTTTLHGIQSAWALGKMRIVH